MIDSEQDDMFVRGEDGPNSPIVFNDAVEFNNGVSLSKTESGKWKNWLSVNLTMRAVSDLNWCLLSYRCKHKWGLREQVLGQVKLTDDNL